MTSSTEILEPLVKSLNPYYSSRLLRFNGFNVMEIVGSLLKVEGFDDYNQLLEINRLFSTNPIHDPVDRTDRIKGPVRWAPVRPWHVPTIELDLETALQKRVENICTLDERINLFWSGGIDSTAIVVSFLQYADDLKRCRVIYSPWSTYEHPDFFKMLQGITDIELVDVSGDLYFSLDLDGVFVSGNAGDEMHASLDESFFTNYGYEFLSTPWQDFFSKDHDNKFIEFCEEYFSAAGRDINTVLEARWWFYSSSKLSSILNNFDLRFLTSGPTGFDPKRLIGFFDCDEYEQFIYFNLDKIISSENYASWRQFLKDYCYRYDGFEDWRINKAKFGSGQIKIYSDKKMILNDARNLMILEDGHQVATPNLPLFSSVDWDEIHHKYRYVFRQPDSL